MSVPDINQLDKIIKELEPKSSQVNRNQAGIASGTINKQEYINKEIQLIDKHYTTVNNIIQTLNRSDIDILYKSITIIKLLVILNKMCSEMIGSAQLRLFNPDLIESYTSLSKTVIKQKSYLEKLNSLILQKINKMINSLNLDDEILIKIGNIFDILNDEILYNFTNLDLNELWIQIAIKVNEYVGSDIKDKKITDALTKLSKFAKIIQLTYGLLQKIKNYDPN